MHRERGYCCKSRALELCGTQICLAAEVGDVQIIPLSVVNLLIAWGAVALSGQLGELEEVSLLPLLEI